MDCENLSPNARKIFEEIKRYYPPDPWNNQQWTVDGRVYDNGWYDLKKGEDRVRLIGICERTIGFIIVTFAQRKKNKNEELNESIFDLGLLRRHIELGVLFYKLDFQIETMDLVDD